MRIKYLIPAVLAAAALPLSACSDSATNTAHVKISGLSSAQKSVVATWYDNAASSERTRMEKMTAKEVKESVIAFALLCAVRESEAAQYLTNPPYSLPKDGAAKLADAIDDRLCDKRKTPATPAVPPSPADKSERSEPKNKPSPQSPGYTNPSHDLSKPPSRHDREDAPARMGLTKDPAAAHKTGTQAAPRTPAPRPASPPVRRAPARTR